MRRLFAEHPEAIERTVDIAQRCRFRLERLTGQFPFFPVEEGKTRQTYLRELVYSGAAERYPVADRRQRRTPARIRTRHHRQDGSGRLLSDRLGHRARSGMQLGVLCQGRGSAANSAVCYALGITAVDPIGMKLLFERFMSEERREIPDIDIDFAHQDREKSHSIRLRPLRAQQRGDGGRGDQLSHALGAARRRQGARLEPRASRRGRASSSTRANRSPARPASAKSKKAPRPTR